MAALDTARRELQLLAERLHKVRHDPAAVARIAKEIGEFSK